ncbi:MAG TPA: Uma2 family endonuclease [Planctomycetota bacterium]|nr:Uma2 family endonuclease [Planctomycetota bacterium]
MIARGPGSYTVEDFDALPDTGPQYQLVDGELMEMTVPTTWHQEFLWRLGARMRLYVEERRLGRVLGAPIGVYLSQRDVFQPDLFFLSSARDERFEKKGIIGAPELIVEVLSPSTRRLDLGRKRETYAMHGVHELWVADVERETIAVYELQKDPETPVRTLARGDTLTTPLIPGFGAEVTMLFAR